MVNSKVPMKRKLTPSTNSGKTSKRISNLEWFRIMTIETNLLFSRDGTLLTILLNYLHWMSIFQEWKKDRNIFTIWEVRINLFLLSLHLSKDFKNKDMKLYWEMILLMRPSSILSENIKHTESSMLLEMISSNHTRMMNWGNKSNIWRRYTLLWSNTLKINWKMW